MPTNTPTYKEEVTTEQQPNEGESTVVERTTTISQWDPTKNEWGVVGTKVELIKVSVRTGQEIVVLVSEERIVDTNGTLAAGGSQSNAGFTATGEVGAATTNANAAWASGSVGFANPNPYTEAMDKVQSFLNNINSYLDVALSFVDVTEATALAAIDAVATALKALKKVIEDFLDTLRIDASITWADVPYNWMGESQTLRKLKSRSNEAYNKKNAAVQRLKAMAKAATADVWSADASELGSGLVALGTGDVYLQEQKQYPGGPAGLRDLVISSINSGGDKTPYVPEKSIVAGLSIVVNLKTPDDYEALRKLIIAILKLAGTATREAVAVVQASVKWWDAVSLGKPYVQYWSGTYTLNWHFRQASAGDKVIITIPKEFAQNTAKPATITYEAPPLYRVYVTDGAPDYEDLAKDAPSKWKDFTQVVQDVALEDKWITLPADSSQISAAITAENIKYRFTTFGNVRESPPLTKLTAAIKLKYASGKVKQENLPSSFDMAPYINPICPVPLIIESLAGTGMPRHDNSALTWEIASAHTQLGDEFRLALKPLMQWIDSVATSSGDLIKSFCESLRKLIREIQDGLTRLSELIELLKQLGEIQLSGYIRAFQYAYNPTVTPGLGMIFPQSQDEYTQPEPPSGKAALIKEYTESFNELEKRGANDICAGIFVLLNTIQIPSSAVDGLLRNLAALFGAEIKLGEGWTGTWTAWKSAGDRYAAVSTAWDSVYAAAAAADAKIKAQLDAAAAAAQPAKTGSTTGSLSAGLTSSPTPPTSTTPAVGSTEIGAKLDGLVMDLNCPPPVDTAATGDTLAFGPNLQPINKPNYG